MNKYFALMALLIATIATQAQEVYFYTGKNITNYDYKDASGTSNPNLQAGLGSFYEMGYAMPINDSKFSYAFGVTMNEFNAVGGDAFSSYSWNTEYLGIQNALSYSFLKIKGFSFDVKAGVTVATMVYGKQVLNQAYYDLLDEKDFSGVLIFPNAALQANYNMTKRSYLSLGYAFSKRVDIGNNSAEELTFNTSQIQFGVHFSVK